MAHDETDRTDRRTFLQAGALAAASAASLSPVARAEQDAPAAKTPMVPRRVLGKTGVEITMLDQGAVRGPSLDNVLRMSYAAGVRTFDTAKVYRSEPNFKKWFDKSPEVRKTIFLITKDELRRAGQMVKSVDERLAAIGTDYIDLFFLHGLGDANFESDLKLIKSKEYRDAADAIRKSGKAKFLGFSTHHKRRAELIQAAADNGGVDAIMLQYTPWLDKESPLNKALDSAHKAGIGLISMKQVAGKGGFGDAPKEPALDVVARKMPWLKDKGLSIYQGLLHAIWTDERISSVCISMRNSDQIRENADASRRFEPVKEAHVHQLRDAFLAMGSQTLCGDCDGRCSVAAGTKAELGDLTRFLTYHEHLGDRAKARHEYAKLSAEARDWSGADLEAARAACPNGLDFARLLPKVDDHLA